MEYLLGGKHEVEILAVEGVREDGAGKMASDFHSLSELNPGLKGHLFHIALAFQPEEREINNEEMVRISLKYMRRMKIDPENTAWAIVRHTERDHQHVHLVISRVDYDGKTISDSHSHANSLTACRKIEKEHGLINAVETGATRKRIAAEPSRAWLESKAFIRDVGSWCLPHVAHIDELVDVFKKEKIEGHLVYRKNGEVQGIYFEHNKQRVKGSAVDRGYSLNNLLSTIDGQRERVLAEREQLRQFDRALTVGSNAISGFVRAVDTYSQQQASDKRVADAAAAAAALAAEQAAAQRLVDAAREKALRVAEEQARIREEERLEIGKKCGQVLKTANYVYGDNQIAKPMKAGGVIVDAEKKYSLEGSQNRFSTDEINVGGRSLTVVKEEKYVSNDVQRTRDYDADIARRAEDKGLTR